MDPTDALQASPAPAGTSPATAVHHSLVNASSEQCPSCGSVVAPDQRYCLHCGQRCGEPRLPFMNAVTFMDSMRTPAAAPAALAASQPRRRRISPNAALIAGVATLLLAMGVGVLIGRSGDQTVASNAPATPQVITVHGGGEAETAGTAKQSKAAGGTSKGSKKASASAKKKAESGQGAEEVLKPSAGVKLPPATAQPGSKCESGAAGCKGGEFTGEFFGE